MGKKKEMGQQFALPGFGGEELPQVGGRMVKRIVVVASEKLGSDVPTVEAMALPKPSASDSQVEAWQRATDI